MKVSYWYLFLFPPLVLFDILALNPITSLLSQPSDMKVAAGIGLAVILVLVHVVLIRLLYRKLRNE